MTKFALSVLIPARNEYYLDIDLLHETVVNVLANTSKRTQVIAVLDGYTDSWPKQPLPVNDRLTVIHHRQSIGQRAATNEAARVATGEYLMKLDAHCALDEKFDEKLLATFEPHWTVVPAQYNLLAFNWRCSACGNLHDQGPQPNRCEKCKGRRWQQQKLWIPRDGREGSDGKGGRRNSLTHSWRFDSNLDFQYFGAYAADQHHAKKHKVLFRPEAQLPIHDTMSLLGACWAMTRKRYFEIEPCDESFGSWGDMGTEISCKTWLSGGELKCNTTTWFAHFFRVGGLGFPYEGGGRKERAKARGKELWLKNLWPKQVYPLSWLVDKFKPVPDWHTGDNPVLAEIIKAGASFRPIPSLPKALAGSTVANKSPAGVGLSGSAERMSSKTLSLTSVNNSGSTGISTDIVPVVGSQGDMEGVTARGVVAGSMIENGNSTTSSTGKGFNQPSVHVPVGQFNVSHIAVSDVAVTHPVAGAVPDPAVQRPLNGDSREEAGEFTHVRSLDYQHSGSHGLTITNRATMGYLFYTCNSHDETLETAARNNLLRAKGKGELGCVSLKRSDFGDWNIVVDAPKGPLTMHRQILMGLERLRSDYVFMCENDMLYHSSHFEFIPPSDTEFFYNTNVWRVRYKDGFAVKTADCKQLSGLCASRKTLLEHYRKRVDRIAREGFSRKNGYEPGTRGLPWGFDSTPAESWSSQFPNLDIKSHGENVTKGQWSPDDFRNKKYTEGWQESTGRIEPWPLFYGRLQEWLKELADG